MPFAYASPLMILNPRTAFGGIFGAVILAIVSEFVIEWDHNHPQHWLGMIVFTAFGFAFGAAIYSLRLKQWILGSIVFAASLVTLVCACNIEV